MLATSNQNIPPVPAFSKKTMCNALLLAIAAIVVIVLYSKGILNNAAYLYGGIGGLGTSVYFLGRERNHYKMQQKYEKIIAEADAAGPAANARAQTTLAAADARAQSTIATADARAQSTLAAANEAAQSTLAAARNQKTQMVTDLANDGSIAKATVAAQCEQLKAEARRQCDALQRQKDEIDKEIVLQSKKKESQSSSNAASTSQQLHDQACKGEGEVTIETIDGSLTIHRNVYDIYFGHLRFYPSRSLDPSDVQIIFKEDSLTLKTAQKLREFLYLGKLPAVTLDEACDLFVFAENCTIDALKKQAEESIASFARQSKNTPSVMVTKFLSVSNPHLRDCLLRYINRFTEFNISISSELANQFINILQSEEAAKKKELSPSVVDEALGWCHYNGIGMVDDINKAARYWYKVTQLTNDDWDKFNHEACLVLFAANSEFKILKYCFEFHLRLESTFPNQYSEYQLALIYAHQYRDCRKADQPLHPDLSNVVTQDLDKARELCQKAMDRGYQRAIDFWPRIKAK